MSAAELRTDQTVLNCKAVNFVNAAALEGGCCSAANQEQYKF